MQYHFIRVNFKNKCLAVGVLALLAVGCRNHPTTLDTMQPSQVNWKTYTHPSLRYALELPAQFRADEETDGSVLFRHAGGGVPLLVRFTDEEEGRKRGAWFGHEPRENITLDGQVGEKFVYYHYDGPSSVRTVAYVVKHQGKFLGLEFRTDDDVNAMRRHILESFRFVTN